MKCIVHQVKGHGVRLPAGDAQGLLAHSIPLVKLRPTVYVSLRGAFSRTDKHGWEMAHYYHTKASAFYTLTAKRVKGYYVCGTYWRRPNDLRTKVEVIIVMERLGYKGGAYLGTKEEATLNIESFRLHIKQICKTHSNSGGGSSIASHTKVYSAATRNTTRSGRRDEVVAEAGFEARKRPLGTEQPEVKK